MKYLVLAATVLSAPAWAAKPQDQVRVALPSEMIRASIEEQAPPEPPRGSWLSMAAGYFSPSSLSAASLVPNATEFKTSLPYLSATFVSTPFLEGRAGSLALRLGFGVSGLKRTGGLSVSGASQTLEQKAFLLPGEAGLEGRPAPLQGSRFAMHVDASAAPNLLITQPSPLGDAKSYFSLAARGQIAGEYALSGRLPNDELRLELAVLGAFASSSSEIKVNGLGILAGLRFRM